MRSHKAGVKLKKAPLSQVRKNNRQFSICPNKFLLWADETHRTKKKKQQPTATQAKLVRRRITRRRANTVRVQKRSRQQNRQRKPNQRGAQPSTTILSRSESLDCTVSRRHDRFSDRICGGLGETTVRIHQGIGCVQEGIVRVQLAVQTHARQ